MADSSKKYISLPGLQTYNELILAEVESSINQAMELVDEELSKKYVKPESGIPLTDLTSSVQNIVNSAITSVSNKSATLAFGKSSTIATVGNTDITVTLPSENKITYTLSTGTTNGTLKLTPSTGMAQDNIKVKGIESLAFKSSLAFSELTGSVTNAQIESIDAAKITSGTISIDRIPAAALERCVVVKTDTERLALTSSEIQLGDTVKVTGTSKMYMVIDSSKLGTEDAFTEYVATSSWSTITNKPTTVSEFGLTDAYTKTQTDEAISTAIGNAIAASY